MGLGEVSGDSGQFGAGVAAGVVVVPPLSVDGLGDQIVAGSVERAQRLEYGRVDGVGVEAGEVALVAVVAGAVEAGVVAV
ncbi:hypothetical protein ACIBCN_19750 [Nocardia sp. NPDC051052]|uniref:hypothetical protein n=1 Tax=Nocardia sp. NPDC051052 TaxID=3364322 RepID=UPI0037B457B0